MMKPQLLYNKAISTLTNDGVITLCLKALKMLYGLAYYSTSSLWFSRPLSEPIPEPDTYQDLTVEFLIDKKKILVDWLKTNNSTFTWMYIEKEIELAKQEKHIFVNISLNSQIIGYIKIGINRTYIHDFDKVADFPAGTAFIYDTFILPEYRRNNISYYAITKTLRYLAEHNYRKLFCHIEGWNRASLKLFKKAGFKNIGTVRFSKIIGLPIFLINGYIPSTSIKSILA